LCAFSLNTELVTSNSVINIGGTLFAAYTYRFRFRLTENTLGLLYRGTDKSLSRPTCRCILFDGENISFGASLVIYINSNNIHPIMIINRIYENQNLLSLLPFSFPVGLRTYQHTCISFDASLVIYINSTNISPIMIIYRIYENQNLLSL